MQVIIKDGRLRVDGERAIRGTRRHHQQWLSACFSPIATQWSSCKRNLRPHLIERRLASRFVIKFPAVCCHDGKILWCGKLHPCRAIRQRKCALREPAFVVPHHDMRKSPIVTVLIDEQRLARIDGRRLLLVIMRTIGHHGRQAQIPAPRRHAIAHICRHRLRCEIFERFRPFAHFCIECRNFRLRNQNALAVRIPLCPIRRLRPFIRHGR